MTTTQRTITIILALFLTVPHTALAGSDALAASTSETWEATPLMGAEVGMYTEALVLSASGSGEDTVDQRTFMNTRLTFGLDVALPSEWLPHGALEMRSEVGLGLVYERGQWPIHLRQSVAWELPLGVDWVAFVVGVGAGAQINASNVDFSFFELAFPIHLRLDFVDIGWHPALLVGLGGEEDAVFGGTLEHSIATDITLINFSARFRIDPLSF